MKKKSSSWGFTVLIVLALFGWSALVASVDHSISPWWRIPAMAVAISLFLVRPLGRMWQRYTSFKNVWANRILGVFVCSGVLAGLFTGLNFITRPGCEVHKVRYEVTRLYSTKHQNRRRVGRHYVATGTVHYKYHAEFELEDGRKMEVPVPIERYRRMHKGDSVTVAIHPGLLGTDFITTAR